MVPATISMPMTWPLFSHFWPSVNPRTSRYQRMERARSDTVRPGRVPRSRNDSGCRRVVALERLLGAARFVAVFLAGVRFRFADFLVAIPVSLCVVAGL